MRAELNGKVRWLSVEILFQLPRFFFCFVFFFQGSRRKDLSAKSEDGEEVLKD